MYKKSSPIPLFLKINNKALIAMFKFRWFWNFITFFAANALQSANFVLQYLFEFNLAMYSLQHNADYVSAAKFGGCFCFFRLNYQPHILHTVAVSRSGGDNINSCGVYAWMTENICKLGNILFNSVKHPCN